MNALRTVLWLGALVGCVTCGADRGVPDVVHVRCDASADCPPGWYCPRAGALCEPSDAQADPAVVLNPSVGLVTDEGGGVDELAVALSARPEHPVSVWLQSDDPLEGVVSPGELIFVPEDWSKPQSVGITGVADCTPDGPVHYSLRVSVSSDDPAFDGIDVPAALVTNIDDPNAGIVLRATQNLTTTEAQGSAIFFLRLECPPAVSVDVIIVSSDRTEGIVTSPQGGLLTIDRDNWTVEHPVVVTGQDDGEADGDQSYAIDFVIRVNDLRPGDPEFAPPASVLVTNQDDD